MKVDPRKAAFFIPPDISRGKLNLFHRLAKTIGHTVTTQDELAQLPDELVPVIGCSYYLADLVADWRARGRRFVYWDRGYLKRRGLTWLEEGQGNGYYRWHVDSFQLERMRDVPADRWEALRMKPEPWRKGRNVVVCGSSPSHIAFHRLGSLEAWTESVVSKIKAHTDRPLVIKAKDDGIPLPLMLADAHALVCHSSNAAVEATFMGVPAFADRSCATAVLGNDDLAFIEAPAYPEREPWLRALAYSQFTDAEMLSGKVWELID